MKLSQYAFQLPHRDAGRAWLFHSLTRAIVEVSRNALANDLSAETLAGLSRAQFEARLSDWAPLLDGYFVVDDDIDEYKAFLYWFNKERFKTETAIITFLTTAQCNLKCGYCYEDGYVRPRSHMSAGVVGRAFEAVRRLCESCGCKAVDFTFFGGEPLLNIPLMERTMAFLNRLNKDRGLRVQTNVVTNGVLLHKENRRRLKRAGVSSLQITIDGMAKDHDRRRPFHSGQGSFATVYENMLASVAEGFSVVLNMNFDQSNHGGLTRLLEAIPRPDRSKMDISFSPIKTTKLNRASQACGVSHSDEAVLLRKLCRKAVDEGYRFPDFQYTQYGPCHFLRANSLIVDPEGRIYKCIYGIGDPAYGAGTVFEPREVIEQNLAQFTGAVPRYSDKCQACGYLPLCLGGCRKDVMDSGQDSRGTCCKKEAIREAFIQSLGHRLNTACA